MKINKKIIFTIVLLDILLLAIFGTVFSILSVIGAIWFVYGWIFMLRISKIKNSKKLKILANSYTIAHAGFLISFIIIEGILITHLVKLRDVNETKNFKYVIVLGAGLDGEEVSNRLKGRLDKTIEYYNKNRDVTIIVSGGQGKDEKISEAEAMEKYLINKGISSNQIIKENKSTSTIENIKFSLTILKDLGALDEEVLIITSDYHLFRAQMIANKLNIKNQGLANRTFLWTRINYMIREYAAILKDYIKLRL